ncbi:MAG: RNA polymerase sigma factor RpoH [Candidatus Competibacterales bacterium]
MSTALMTKSMQLPVNLNDLDSYIHYANSLPLLSEEQEQDLARRLRELSDLDAARELVLAHLRFVVRVARSYLGYGLPLGDLIQEGNVGLMKAVKRFDPDQGVRLVSFAIHWIKAEIQEFILRNWRIVKVATTKAQRKLFFNLRSAKKRLGWLNRDEAMAVAENLGVSPETVFEMESRLGGQDIAFDPDPSDDDDDTLAPVAFLAASGSDPVDQLSQEDWEEQAHHQLEQAMAALDDRSRDIIERRRLHEPKATLQELAAQYGVSAERVRQLENAALKRLKVLMVDPAA